jgi:acetylornithine/N-succinyldiaminopimelate aminotransferase
VRETGAYLSSALGQLSVDLCLKGVDGVGLLLRLDLGRPIGSQVSAYAQDELARDPEVGYGLLLNSPRPHLIRFLPALDVAHSEIDAMVLGLRRTISRVL